ncbi:hypothetical protein ACIPSA_19980 [Streptomyces sp. NPDC086549]|uniref:hypothetical protein n=1 Tax=Streptomyces sp. NPDC086549 TaxID=3365752 RepID=UPI003815CE22
MTASAPASEAPQLSTLDRHQLDQEPEGAAVRARTIVVILAVAVGLGLLTGRFVLPARSAPGAPTAMPSAAASSPGSGSPAPKPADGPMADRHLLAAAEFTKAGFSKRIYVRDRVGDGRYANAACAGEKTLGETLGGPDAHFRGLVTTRDTDDSDPTLAVNIEDQVAREVAAEAESPALAQNFAQRLLLEEVPCQEEPAGHWVYGPTHTIDVAPGITASWMGSYDGDLNTAGTAPRGKEPCGGIAILRNGSHYGVLEVDACLDTAAMTRIVRAAVTQL